MVILVSPEISNLNELTIVNSLFKEGLEYFHLRKPNYSTDELRSYLEGLESQFLDKVVIHSHHQLCAEYGLRGIHFTEQDRICKRNELDLLVLENRKCGFSSSGSFHTTYDIEDCNAPLDYHLLSPVFDSISKEYHLGKHFDISNCKKSVIALGGINYKNCNSTKDMGYNGIAVLGSVWNNHDPIAYFKNLQTQYSHSRAYVK